MFPFVPHCPAATGARMGLEPPLIDYIGRAAENARHA